MSGYDACQWDDLMLRLVDRPVALEIATALKAKAQALRDQPYPAEAAAVEELGLHPDEAKPRDRTFIHERLNWQREIETMRAHIAKLEGRE